MSGRATSATLPADARRVARFFRRRAAALLLLAVLAAPARAQLPPPTASAPGAPPFAPLPPAPGKEVYPHVTIDWTIPAVRVDGQVVRRDAPLEFLAAYAGREHETLIRLDGEPEHLYIALGLIGLSAASDEYPARLRPACADAGPGLADVTIEWLDDGVLRSADPFSWLREVEFGRAPTPCPWRFIGPLRHDAQARAAVQAGDAVGLVTKSDNILSPVRNRSDADADLWVTADPQRAPPEGTPVRLVIRAAEPRPLEVALDARGLLRLNGRLAPQSEVVDAATAAHLLRPGDDLVIDAEHALRADVRRLKQALRAAGIPPHRIWFLGKRAAAENPQMQPSADAPGGERPAVP